jgi:septal ring factor EnvC (AmiA/AmiB activator)
MRSRKVGRKVSGRRLSKRRKRSRRRSSIRTRISFFKKEDPKVKEITLKYKDRIAKSQNKINEIKSKIKNKEDEKAYYIKQQEKKKEERKKIEGMKTKVGSDLTSLNKKIVDIKNERNKLEKKKRIKNEELINLIGERNIKLKKLKM